MKMASRRSFTFKEKAEIISRLKNGENNASLCKEFKVSHSTISSIWKNRDVILECFDSRSLKMKKNRPAAHHDVENALLDWYKDQSQNMRISGRVLQEKANHFAKTLGKIDFKCSVSWIYRFRQRHDISVGKMGAASVSGNEHSIDDNENWLNTSKSQNSVHCVKSAPEQEAVSAPELKTSCYLELTKIGAHCCFCGEVKNDFLKASDKPYVVSRKTTLTLNDLSIEIAFNKESTQETVCHDCDTRFKDILDFLRVIKNAQDKLRYITEVNSLRDLDMQDEDPSNYSECLSGWNVDDYNKAYEHYKGRIADSISDTALVKETGVTLKRKNYEHDIFEPIKKRRFALSLDSPSSHDDNDGREIKIEIDYKAGNNKEEDTLVTDGTVKEVFSADKINVSREFTKDVREDIKKEYDNTDDSKYLDNEAQNQDINNIQQFEQGDSTSDGIEPVCKAGSSIGTLVTEVNVTNKVDSRSDIVSELTSECETVGAMAKSELILLVQSIVRQMLDK